MGGTCCNCPLRPNTGNTTYPIMLRHRQVLRSGRLYWDRQVRCRPLHYRSERCHPHRSHRPGWWGYWCCWVKETHCPQWKWADNRQTAPVSGSHSASLVLRQCCLGQRKHIFNIRYPKQSFSKLYLTYSIYLDSLIRESYKITDLFCFKIPFECISKERHIS